MTTPLSTLVGTLVTTLSSGLAVALLLAGLTFVLGGAVGLVRLPDLYARAHAASKCDTVGAGTILVALALLDGPAVSDLKLVLLVLLIAATGPTTAHALARSAHRTSRTPWSQDEEETP